MPTKYEMESERLAKLPRAQRFEALIEFPTAHTFKVIGRNPGFAEQLKSALDGAGRREVCLVERPSARGTYASLTFVLAVNSGDELDGLYRLLEAMPGLVYLL